MTEFEQDKANKLQRMWLLRLLNMLWVVAWQEDSYHCANQKFRIIHPITWVVVMAFLLIGSVVQGVPETIRNLREGWKTDFVRW